MLRRRHFYLFGLPFEGHEVSRDRLEQTVRSIDWNWMDLQARIMEFFGQCLIKVNDELGPLASVLARVLINLDTIEVWGSANRRRSQVKLLRAENWIRFLRRIHRVGNLLIFWVTLEIHGLLRLVLTCEDDSLPLVVMNRIADIDLQKDLFFGFHGHLYLLDANIRIQKSRIILKRAFFKLDFLRAQLEHFLSFQIL